MADGDTTIAVRGADAPQIHTPYYDYVFINRIELVSGAVDAYWQVPEERERTTR